MLEQITKLEELEAIRKVVARGWTQRCAARDADGHPVSSLDPDATKWCLSGARNRAWEDNSRRESGNLNLSDYLHPSCGFRNYVAWNDAPERTQEQVLAFLDQAIEIEKARAAASA